MKKAFITGASSGIGKAFAKRYAAMGYQITLVARHEDKLKETIALLTATAGQKHGYLIADLSQKEGREEAMKELREAKYDVLINNAGIGAGFGFEEVPLDKIMGMIELNCLSLTALTHQYLQDAAAGDAIINIGSIVSFVPYPGLAAYSATKAFVLSLTEALYPSCKKKGVKIIAVCPGPTDTGFFKAAGETPETAPAKETLGSPDTVVDQALSALQRNKLYVVTGNENKLMIFCARHLPIKLSLWLASRM